MSNAEHLIENAVSVIENDGDFTEFSSAKHNQDMAKAIHIELSHVWDMATYVVFTLKQYWKNETSDLDDDGESLNAIRVKRLREEGLL